MEFIGPSRLWKQTKKDWQRGQVRYSMCHIPRRLSRMIYPAMLTDTLFLGGVVDDDCMYGEVASIEDQQKLCDRLEGYVLDLDPCQDTNYAATLKLLSENESPNTYDDKEPIFPTIAAENTFIMVLTNSHIDLSNTKHHRTPGKIIFPSIRTRPQASPDVAESSPTVQPTPVLTGQPEPDPIVWPVKANPDRLIRLLKTNKTHDALKKVIPGLPQACLVCGRRLVTRGLACRGQVRLGARGGRTKNMVGVRSCVSLLSDAHTIRKNQVRTRPRRLFLIPCVRNYVLNQTEITFNPSGRNNRCWLRALLHIAGMPVDDTDSDDDDQVIQPVIDELLKRLTDGAYREAITKNEMVSVENETVVPIVLSFIKLDVAKIIWIANDGFPALCWKFERDLWMLSKIPPTPEEYAQPMTTIDGDGFHYTVIERFGSND